MATNHTIPPLIGLSGYARTGKDSVATVLSALFGYERFAFADGIRTMLEILDPMIGLETSLTREVAASGWDAVKGDRFHGAEARRLMQLMGDAGRRLFGPNAWVTALESVIAEQVGQFGQSPIVVSDVRFPNEAEWVRRNGGVIWRVDRPGVGPINGHVSEKYIEEISPDLVLQNDGDLSCLAEKVEDAIAAQGTILARRAHVA